MNSFEICYQFVCHFLNHSLLNFQSQNLKMSQKWNYHFTYISPKKEKFPSLPPEIAKIEQQDIYINICFSACYLNSFLIEETLFKIPIAIDENILFSQPLKMACFFHQCAYFRHAPWKEKERMDILWRCYALERQVKTNKKAIQFFCRYIEKMEKSKIYEKNVDDLAMKYIANRLFENYEK